VSAARTRRVARLVGLAPRRVLLAIAFACACTCVGPAAAASFDCARARQADERAICNDRALNDRDVTMSVLYGLDRRFLAMGGRGLLMDEQAAWLRGRRACGADRACLARSYDHRIAQLRRIIDTRVVTNGPF
jgi:uncharacterized protein